MTNLTSSFNSNSITNRCWRSTDDGMLFERPQFYLLATALVLLNFVVVVGNAAVILAVLTTKRLRTVNDNFFLVSLAVSDLALGIFVLPFSAVTEILSSVWIFESSYCKFWLTLDIWLCTSSIYNLMAIAVDRYLAVARPLTYKLVMNDRRKLLSITSAWTLAFLISCPSVLYLWPEADRRASVGCECSQINNNAAFTLFSATASFYVPIAFIFTLYFKMYQIIRRVSGGNERGFIRCHRPEITVDFCTAIGPDVVEDYPALPNRAAGAAVDADGYCLRVHKGRYNIRGSATASSLSVSPDDGPSSDIAPQSPEPLRNNNFGRRRSSTFVAAYGASTPLFGSSSRQQRRKSYFPERLSTFTKRCELRVERYHKRLALEVRALKTVGLVTGCFFVCWAGFCIVYTSQAFPSCRNNGCLPDILVSIAVWMGYANSALNPFIYAACSRQYRSALLRLFRCDRF